MSVYTPPETYSLLRYGYKAERGATALPASAAAALFNVTGGRVAITKIVGQVTTVIETKANNTKLTANPTVGTSVDICAVLNITADEVGTLYGITGTNTDALIGINAGALPGQTRDVVVNAGTIDLDCAATNTGAVKWSIWYVPIDEGATVTAA